MSMDACHYLPVYLALRTRPGGVGGGIKGCRGQGLFFTAEVEVWETTDPHISQALALRTLNACWVCSGVVTVEPYTSEFGRISGPAWLVGAC